MFEAKEEGSHLCGSVFNHFRPGDGRTGQGVVEQVEREGVHATLGSSFSLDEPTVLVIHDLWTGYSFQSPISADYELARTPRGSYVGSGRLATAHKQREISAAAARTFFAALAGARLEATARLPQDDVTDSYPSIEISIRSDLVGRGQQEVVLRSESQDSDHAPWTVPVGRNVYYANQSSVGDALKALDSPLQRSVPRKMSRV